MTTYICHLLNGRVPQDKPPPEYYAFLKEVRAIGRNINQIAMVANATGIIEAEKYQSDFDALMDAMLHIREAAELPRGIT
jgi:hypothetical protein